jgi:hypothetical protein
MVGVYQAPGGGMSAVAAHCSSDGTGTDGDIGLEGLLESARQRLVVGVPGACAVPLRRQPSRRRFDAPPPANTPR